MNNHFNQAPNQPQISLNCAKFGLPLTCLLKANSNQSKSQTNSKQYTKCTHLTKSVSEPELVSPAHPEEGGRAPPGHWAVLDLLLPREEEGQWESALTIITKCFMFFCFCVWFYLLQNIFCVNNFFNFFYWIHVKISIFVSS